MIPIRTVLAVSSLSLAFACTSSGPPPLSAEALRAHVEVLAADDMQGREMGSPGALRAAEYISSVLQKAGFAMAGGMGTYQQDIGMHGYSTKGDLSAEFVGPAGKSFDALHGVDLRWLRGPPRQFTLDVKLVAAREDLPEFADPHVALVLPVDGRTAMSWLGATHGDGWGAVIFAGPSTVGEPSSPPAMLIGDGNDPALLMARGPLAADLAAGAYHTLHLKLDGADPVPAVNVVGLLPSEDWRDEAIVLMAHYDHIGLADEGDDRVFNGADDDASGVAMVLEIARALADGGSHGRAVVVLLVTGEERGLLGSRAYVQAPAVPLHSTVAALNFEMVGRPDPNFGPGELWLTGYDRSDLGSTWAQVGLPISADPYPDQSFFMRSDNASFARAGIVSQTLSSFGMHDDYHRVTDEVHTLDFEHMAACAEVAYTAVRILVDKGFTPTWSEDGRPQ